jgi:hypothetical protein
MKFVEKFTILMERLSYLSAAQIRMIKHGVNQTFLGGNRRQLYHRILTTHLKILINMMERLIIFLLILAAQKWQLAVAIFLLLVIKDWI